MVAYDPRKRKSVGKAKDPVDRVLARLGQNRTSGAGNTTLRSTGHVEVATDPVSGIAQFASKNSIHLARTMESQLQQLMEQLGFKSASQSKRNSRSIMSFFSEDLSLDPRFFELQEELRSVLFAGLSSLSPSRPSTPEDEVADTLDFSRVTVAVPHARLLRYLQNWITECAPHLDKFDEDQHFQIQVPLMARKSPALLYAMLAFSSRQMERRGLTQKGCDSLELYQESIRLLTPGLQAKDPNMLVTACILAVFELMSGGARNWRRHVEGCASLFEYFGVNGFSGGLPQAVFWCYARMELCGAIISDSAETTVLPLDQWVPAMGEQSSSPEVSERFVQNLFHQKSRTSPDTHANWAIYLCTKVCHLRFRRTQYLELGRADWQDSRPFAEQWQKLWEELQFWLDERPPSMRPIRVVEASEKQIFPLIMFPHWAAISSNQVYHAACILMLEMQPPEQNLDSQCLALWHARSVVGISCANPHPGSMVNSIQPLFVAGRLFSHVSERRQIAQLLKSIDRTTGWGALWRLRDLEAEWGYEVGHVFDDSAK